MLTFEIIFFSLLLFFAEGHASLKIQDLPSTIIRGPDAELDHPEGCAFSPSGDYIAVANLFNDSVTFYPSNWS